MNKPVYERYQDLSIMWNDKYNCYYVYRSIGRFDYSFDSIEQAKAFIDQLIKGE